MESIAVPIINHTHCGLNTASVEKNIRRRMANAAPLGAIDRKAVMGVGAPWYVSGIQECSGTAPILKPRAAKIISQPTTRLGVMSAVPWAIVGKMNVPRSEEHTSELQSHH